MNNQLNLFPNEEKKRDDQHLWNQFIRLGEMIGDGLHNEPDGRWISREYKRLMLILNPDIREELKQNRIKKNKHIDEQIAKLISIKTCKCGGKLNQLRSGSKRVSCVNCNSKYIAK